MQNRLISFAIALFAITAITARADPIRYDQIPANAVSYFQVDADRLLASRLARIKINGASSIRQNIESPQFLRGFWGSVTSATGYSVERNGSLVLLLRGSAQKFHREIEVPGSTDSVVFEYDRHEVHYSSSWLLPGVFGNGGKNGASNNDVENRLSIGIGGAAFNGSFYTAYVGQDLIVMTIDLPAMAEALDVLDAKRPSLATEDPHGLKAAAPPGLIMIGAGLSAQWTGGNVAGHDQRTDDEAGATTRPVKVADRDFDLDLFGSFKGKARLARFDVGEQGPSDYADATFSMADSDSAGQLKNLLIGIKALLALSQANERPLIEPVAIESAGDSVSLHWSMPTTKLARLLGQGAQAPTHDGSLRTSFPATRPTR